jgi:hypothetical protein
LDETFGKNKLWKWQLDTGMTSCHNPMMMTTIGAIAMLPTAIFHGFTATWEQGTVV